MADGSRVISKHGEVLCTVTSRKTMRQWIDEQVAQTAADKRR
jgi:hypothetical protein